MVVGLKELAIDQLLELDALSTQLMVMSKSGHRDVPLRSNGLGTGQVDLEPTIDPRGGGLRALLCGILMLLRNVKALLTTDNCAEQCTTNVKSLFDPVVQQISPVIAISSPK